MIETLVSNNDRNRYPAQVDPAECNDEGYVKPYFDLETVRRIADDTQAAASAFGHGSIDTVHVIDGGTEDGQPRTLVVAVSWMRIPDKGMEATHGLASGIEDAVEFIEPDEESGLYPVGGLPWCWYALDDELNPLLPFRTEK